MTNNTAYQTLVVDSGSSLSLREGLLLAKSQEEEYEVAISQLSTVIISSQQVSLTSALLSELANHNISVIVCNEKKMPTGMMQSIYGNGLVSANIMKQSQWKQERKDLLWESVVRLKIENSAHILNSFGFSNEALVLTDMSQEVQKGDCTNREALAARSYFRDLFGHNFTRDKDCDINHALNYGYSILASHITRFLVGTGYSTSLGIHHCSIENPYNLTYDLIEPFRVFVDKIVVMNRGCSFTTDYKKTLIAVCETETTYRGKRVLLSYAIDSFCRECLSFMNDKEMRECDIHLVIPE